uniref:Uncharacterized protein n=1 Tax=Anopheles culicifacies TaxID=139723 RepID=A0A182MF71_9DIPT
MWATDLVTPVATTHRDNGQLGQDDGTTDSGGHFLAALHTETDVTVAVTDGDERLEAGTLTSTRLLLDGHDLQHLILQQTVQEEIDDLELFDRERVQVDFLERANLAILYQTAQLRHRHPFLRVFLATASTATTTAASTSATATTGTAT